MLQRFLFVAGMTVGVVAPIVWGAYVSRPPHAVAVQQTAAREPTPHITPVVAPAPATTAPTPASEVAREPALAKPFAKVAGAATADPVPPPATKTKEPVAEAEPLARTKPKLSTTKEAPPAAATIESAATPDVTTTASVPTPMQRPPELTPPETIPAYRAQALAPLPHARPRETGRRAPVSHAAQVPVVVSRYVGPHVIVVCDALTERERRRDGCR